MELGSGFERLTSRSDRERERVGRRGGLGQWCRVMVVQEEEREEEKKKGQASRRMVGLGVWFIKGGR